MRRKLFIIFCVVVFHHQLFAQDPGFSQFYASPLTLNPALTGKFDGSFRAAGNYRDQWPAFNKAFITSTISLDAPILGNRLSDRDTWGLGFMGMTDRTANGSLTSNYLSLSTAYHKGLDEDGLHSIGVGFQGTFVSKRLDGTQLHFQDGLQLDGTWRLSPGEPINSEVVGVNFFDLNAGMLYNGSTNGYNNFYLGTSFYHLNRPQESFRGGYYFLNTRFTMHAGGYFPIAQNALLHLSGMHSEQGGNSMTMIGGAVALNANYDEENPTNLYLGSWYRFGDAVIPYVGLEFNNIQIGATYDVNVSSLKTGSQSRGGIEISLIYIKQRSDGRRKINCPKF